MRYLYSALAAALIALTLPGVALADCSVTQIAVLPVTMEPDGPMIDAKINGTPVRFVADSGAFFSFISPGSAQSLHLGLTSRYEPFEVIGVNGSAMASVTQVKTFTLAGVDLHNVEFVVAGSETGGVGVIGQNVFGLGDVEYDLPHGMIRLMRSRDCARTNLAYWHAERTFTMIPIEPRSREDPHTIGTIYINGKPIKATFDTGAETTMLSLQAAARLGIKPGGPGVVADGPIYGFGRRYVRSWIAKTDLLAIGDGEQIHNARIRFAEMTGDTDMLIGADFFIAHRVYVDNKARRMFLTYEGGPIFNLKTHFNGPAAPGDKPPPAAATAAIEPPSAERFSREGAVALSRNDRDLAVASFTKAIDLAPGEARYVFQRADAYFAQDKPDLARADLDRGLKLKPDAADRLIARAALLLRDDKDDAALADLDAVDRAAAPSAMERLSLGSLLVQAGQPKRAVGMFDQWLKAHPDDVRRSAALNGRCWARALAGIELDQALSDCNGALHGARGEAGILDSRGYVYLRRGDLAKARADFDAALAQNDKQGSSLYGRALAKQRMGDAAGAKADLDAATKADGRIAETMKRFGLSPSKEQP